MMLLSYEDLELANGPNGENRRSQYYYATSFRKWRGRRSSRVLTTLRVVLFSPLFSTFLGVAQRVDLRPFLEMQGNEMSGCLSSLSTAALLLHFSCRRASSNTRCGTLRGRITEESRNGHANTSSPMDRICSKSVSSLRLPSLSTKNYARHARSEQTPGGIIWASVHHYILPRWVNHFVLELRLALRPISIVIAF